MKSGNIPLLAVTVGDPSGIGPEIILKSCLREDTRKYHLVVIGDYPVMLKMNEILGTSLKLNKVNEPGRCDFRDGILNIIDIETPGISGLKPGIVQALCGRSAFLALEKAIDFSLKKKTDAIVTGPLNKEALNLAGYDYPGHTEILTVLTGTKDSAMMLYDKKLSVIHVSTHISLLDAIMSLSQERIEKVTALADSMMKRIIRKPPRIAVAGINPHAGENGLFGQEEINIIGLAVKSMQKRGYNVSGPVSPDTVFLQAVEGKYDIVVAMYHDQGHIPLKLLGFSTGVNVTAGLPFIRTSVDHGTAFEIAWKGIADENSMTEAIRLAATLSSQ